MDAIRGCLAVAYGPLVYCFEGVDQPFGVNLSEVWIHPNSSLKVIKREDLSGNVLGIKAQGAVEDMIGWEDTLYGTLSSLDPLYQDLELASIPYYA